MKLTLQQIFWLIVLGILLIMLGSGISEDWLCLVGKLIFAVALFVGGLFSKEEGVPIRVTMLAIAGLAVLSLASSFSSILSY